MGVLWASDRCLAPPFQLSSLSNLRIKFRLRGQCEREGPWFNNAPLGVPMYSLLQWLSLSSGSRKISEVCVKRSSLLGGVLALFPVSTADNKNKRLAVETGKETMSMPHSGLAPNPLWDTSVPLTSSAARGYSKPHSQNLSLIPKIQVSFPDSKSHYQNLSLIPRL